ncbi:MAG: hypothetical protein AB7L17_16935 [Ilumatobacteraceae bacterium]
MKQAKTNLIDKQNKALKSNEDAAYAAWRDAEDAIADLADRTARRGDGVSPEGDR